MREPTLSAARARTPLFGEHPAIRAFAVRTKRIAPILALVLGILFGSILPARADIGVTATSDQTSYVRGRTNTFTFHLALYSSVFETADNIRFRFPPGIPVSAARYLAGNHTCPDALLLVLGLGKEEAGWFNPGHPSGCGYFTVSSAGDAQTFSVDADIPAGYVGNLPVLVSVDGDGCCDPPPHEASVALTFADSASAAEWSFDDVEVPALPPGWEVATNGATPWSSEAQGTNDVSNDVHAPTPRPLGESFLTSPVISIGSDGGELRFRHRFLTEADRDGAALEIAIDGSTGGYAADDLGPFVDIISAGGAFREGGYTGTITHGNDCDTRNVPLLGREAWSGEHRHFSPVSIVLPIAAAGHRVRFRWHLGADCGGAPTHVSGWWVDDVAVVPQPPEASIGPDKLAVTLESGAMRIETIGIANLGGGLLGYQVATAADGGDCTEPTAIAWLHASDAGTVAGGERIDIPLQIVADALAPGDYAALICVATDDGAEHTTAIPVRLEITAASCATADRIFSNGFDTSVDERCGTSLRTFTRRDAFARETADGSVDDRYVGLRTGNVQAPITFANASFAYSVSTEDDPVNPHLGLFAGSGVLSTASSADQITVTFSGAPVTALGGNFWGGLFFNNQTLVVPSTTVILTIDDRTPEVFTSDGLDGFRGFVSSQPIHRLSIRTPDVTVEGDIPWGVVDELIVGSAR